MEDAKRAKKTADNLRKKTNQRANKAAREAKEAQDKITQQQLADANLAGENLRQELNGMKLADGITGIQIFHPVHIWEQSVS